MSNGDPRDRRDRPGNRPGRPERRDPRRRPMKPHMRRPPKPGEKPPGKTHVAPQKPPRPTAPGPRTDWSGVAEWYDRLVGEEGSEYHRQVVHPGTLRLLALKPGEPVVDVASGQGALARLLQARGAEVTGVDAAEPLVRAARERGPESVRYHVGDARELSFLPAGYF